MVAGAYKRKRVRSAAANSGVAGRARLDGKRMQAARKRLVDEAVTLHPALAFEGRGYDIKPEVSLSPLAPACMAGMKVGFVLDP